MVSFSGNSKNKLKYFFLICGCFIAVTAYAVETPLKLEKKMIEAFSSTQTNAMDLAKARNCMTCHTVGTKIIGPAFKDVAAKYTGQKDAAAKLAMKVMKGGSGVWGTKVMPANAQVSPNEAQTLVKWILALK